MAIAVAITKRASFQGRQEEFANVYQYGGDVGSTEGNAEDLIDYLVGVERPLFGSEVTFVLGFVYEIGGTPSQNQPILRKDLSGTGSSTGAGMYGECALLVTARSSRPSELGRPVYFRKWLHTFRLPPGVTSNSEIAWGKAPLPAAALTYLEDYMRDVMSFQAGTQEYVMQSVNGGVAELPPVAFPYVEHRQFPEGRRERPRQG